MYKFILIAILTLLAACSDVEVVTDDTSTIGVKRHKSKVQVFDYDSLVFQTECWARAYIDTYECNVYIKLSDDLSMFAWPEVYQFELSGHQYAFKKVRCD